jgi:hypothetical protein
VFFVAVDEVAASELVRVVANLRVLFQVHPTYDLQRKTPIICASILCRLFTRQKNGKFNSLQYSGRAQIRFYLNVWTQKVLTFFLIWMQISAARQFSLASLERNLKNCSGTWMKMQLELCNKRLKLFSNDDLLAEVESRATEGESESSEQCEFVWFLPVKMSLIKQFRHRSIKTQFFLRPAIFFALFLAISPKFPPASHATVTIFHADTPHSRRELNETIQFNPERSSVTAAESN